MKNDLELDVIIKPKVEEFPYIPLKTFCLCIAYQRASKLLAFIDIGGSCLLIVTTIIIKFVFDSKGYGTTLMTFFIIFPILALILVSIPRIILAFLSMFSRRNKLKLLRAYSISRMITTFLLFVILCMYLSLCILIHMKVALLDVNQRDEEFLKSQDMKYTIVLIVMGIIVGTLLDIYLSMVAQNFYLNSLDTSNNKQQEIKSSINTNNQNHNKLQSQKQGNQDYKSSRQNYQPKRRDMSNDFAYTSQQDIMVDQDSSIVTDVNEFHQAPREKKSAKSNPNKKKIPSKFKKNKKQSQATSIAQQEVQTITPPSINANGNETSETVIAKLKRSKTKVGKSVKGGKHSTFKKSKTLKEI